MKCLAIKERIVHLFYYEAFNLRSRKFEDYASMSAYLTDKLR